VERKDEINKPEREGKKPRLTKPRYQGMKKARVRAEKRVV
jgi:hypothetical protein